MYIDSEDKNYVINLNHHIKVIYLDYSLINQEKVIMFLNETAPHINLTIVNNSQELDQILEKNSYFDILVLEMFLNNMSTLNLVKELKSKNINIPFIVLTDKDSEDFSSEAFKLGVNRCIIKTKNFLSLLSNSIDKTFLHHNLEKEYKILHQQEIQLFKNQDSFRKFSENIVSKKDIAKFKEAEDSFFKTTERLNFLITGSSAVIYTITGSVNFISDNVYDLLGYKSTDIINNTMFWFDNIHPDDRAEVFHRSSEGYLDEIQIYEYRFLHADGTYKWLHSELKRIKKDNIVESIGYIIDITSRKTSKDIVDHKISEEKIKQQDLILDIMKDAILVINMENNIVFFNKGAENLYGYKKEEILELNITKTIYSLNLAHFDQAMKSVLKNNHWNGKLEYISKNNKKIKLDSNWSLVKDSNNKPLSIIIVNNILNKKNRLKIHRLDSIATLTKLVVHDLNNILTPIVLGLEILKKSLTQGKRQIVLSNMKSSTKKGIKLIKKIIILSKKDKSNFQKLNIKKLLKEVNGMINHTFPNSIDIKLDFDNSLLKIIADKTQLIQLFLDLFINARNSMPNGGQLTVKMEKIYIDEHYTHIHLAAEIGNYILIEIDDTGISIGQQTINEIVDPFFTDHRSDLGLSTANLIVKNHKGFITIYSEVGKGTSFKIYLPENKVNKINKKNKPVKSEMILGSGQLILVVDDESFVRKILQTILEKHGYRVILANDGPEAINQYVKYKNEISLVLMDINMPLMDGLSTIKVLNRIENEIKIIGMSGISANKKLSENFTNYFLEKPFTNAKLFTLISHVLNTSVSTNPQTITLLEKDLLISEEERVKTEFLTTISHEIKTPMNGVIGMTTLLRQTELTSEQKEYVETIEKSENSLLTIINDILDFSKIESKIIELESNNFSIEKCIKDIFNDFSKEASSKKISLVYKISPNVPRFVKGDVERFKQIIYHLVNNGLKFIESGRLAISVEVIKNENNILTLKFLAKDTGIGINENTLSKIFQPFTQSDSSNKRKYGGTGIGLALSKKIIELMNGSIWVKSEIGVGSEFHFIINLAEADKLSQDNLSVTEKQIIPDSDFSQHYPYKILLAEDNLINQKVAVKLFEKMGYKIDIANNGLEATAAVKENRYSIIFMDIQMPEMDGIEATKFLLNKYPNSCPSIVALTANAAQHDSEFFIKLGMSDFIAKPVSIDNLKRVLIKLQS